MFCLVCVASVLLVAWNGRVRDRYRMVGVREVRRDDEARNPGTIKLHIRNWGVRLKDMDEEQRGAARTDEEC